MASRSEWRGLSRALRSDRRHREPSGWSALAGWIWRHLPELFVVLLVVMVWRWLAGFVGGLLAVLPLAALLAGALAWAPSRTVLAVVAGLAADPASAARRSVGGAGDHAIRAAAGVPGQLADLGR